MYLSTVCCWLKWSTLVALSSLVFIWVSCYPQHPSTAIISVPPLDMSKLLISYSFLIFLFVFQAINGLVLLYSDNFIISHPRRVPLSNFCLKSQCMLLSMLLLLPEYATSYLLLTTIAGPLKKNGRYIYLYCLLTDYHSVFC